MKKCEACKKEIYLPTKRQRYCSVECRWPDYYAYKSPPIISYKERLKDWENRVANIK